MQNSSTASDPLKFLERSENKEYTTLRSDRPSYREDDSLNRDRNIEEIAKHILSRATRYDGQLKDLDARLRENMSNFRAIEGSIKDALSDFNRNAQRADYALNNEIPKLRDELEESLVVLQRLACDLPRIRSRVTNIRNAYDSGRKKAQELVSDLTWLNTDFHERWRIIIFSFSAPVSWRWKVTMRILFAAAFITFTWIAWVAIGGAYRAHRQRLVWGERLMS
ncbi:hypothetical protein F5I97DRAFT_1839128 [Phlebopus sp. FC_14]|nr:hypothetical protein F5I97DRAFT_1839128 [Phlebopus sp. FC_14]